MAVQAQQQFLEIPSLICNNNNGDGSVLGWVDTSGGLPMDLLRPLQEQQPQRKTMTPCSALGSQLLTQMGGYACPPPSTSAELSSSLALAYQIDKQKREIQQFLCLQNERLRAALQQQTKNHVLSLMRTLEAKASALLRHKEEELARASRTAAELEQRLRRSEAEIHAWQSIARENEAMALALSNTLKQVRDNACLSSVGAVADPAASCCSSSTDPPGSGVGGGGGHPEAVEWGQGEGVTGPCRGCGVGDSRMLFLPCMHLCTCKLCDPLLASCLVCGSVKQGSMEVLFS